MGAVSDSLRAPNKRQKVQDAQIVVKIPSAAKALIETISAKEGVSGGAVVRAALAEYLDRRGYRS